MQVSAHDYPLTSPSHPALAVLPDVPTEDQIEEFGQLCLQHQTAADVMNLNTMRHVADSLEGRSVVIPAGAYLVGLPHKQSGLAMCVGDITVWTAQGRQRFTGAHVIETQPGGMRVGFAHADTTWLTVHANKTGSADPCVIEDSLVDRADRLTTRRTGALQ